MTTRRQFLSRSLAVAAAMSGLGLVLRPGWAADPALALASAGFGPLLADPAGLFDLPKGFSYRVLSRAGATMADGRILPGLFDGMAAFAVDDRTVLIRNHELDPDSPSPFPGSDPGSAAVYDRGAPGCTTTLVLGPDGAVEREFLSLGGTLRNCAGGPTPWNSWITCEETTQRAGGRLLADHGFAFDVPATIQPGLAEPRPLTALGRFRREAVAIDPLSGIVYQTEDAPEGVFWRFVPVRPGDLHAGGQLEALRIRDFTGDTANWQRRDVAVGQSFTVEWVAVDDVLGDPARQARERGAHRFTRGEGLWLSGDRLWFTATDGGAQRRGQVWMLTGDRLTLFAEPDDARLLENADNLTVAPWGDLVLCEDAVGRDLDPGQHLLGLNMAGVPYRLGRNRLNLSELAGACFAPDGKTLFVNIYDPGITLAITGPWLG
jgi:secreted PhoX family phosphatase